MAQSQQPRWLSVLWPILLQFLRVLPAAGCVILIGRQLFPWASSCDIRDTFYSGLEKASKNVDVPTIQMFQRSIENANNNRNVRNIVFHTLLHVYDKE